ncbi:MAG: HAD-IIIC family phosphatase [Oscillospiraceae bacterium]|nr:HAD-IIIC family phosphatase [Oscillospiraceae bacterium]
MLGYPFDPSEILQNRRRLKRLLSQKEGLLPKRIALRSASSIGSLKDMLELFLLDSGIEPLFFEGDYGRVYADALYSEELAAFKPELVYIHTSVRCLELPAAGSSKEEAEALLSESFSRYRAAWRALKQRLGCPVIQDNFEYPRLRVTGSFEACSPSGKLRFVRRLNELFAQYAEDNSDFYLNDLNWLAAYYGLREFCDTTAYNSYKYSVSPAMTPCLAHSVANIIKSLYGKNKKALVCDLDNTLWGGAVGDEGAEGLALGLESPEGMAYLDMQRYASELPGIGILLAVNSKNEEAAAKSGFGHPSALLKPGDFAAFKANWEPKDRNLADIARELNIGADALVFADDNPAERELVRRSLSEVAVPELSVSEFFAETVANAGYFEVTSLSEDDAKRAAMYRENARRAAAETAFADYGDYLRSLEMKAFLAPFSERAAERISQLANKTNQFNLTTRRYAAGELLGLARDGRHLSLTARLEDRFGDNGLVSELLAALKGDTAEIELWVMSCRVFKRELELAVFDELVRLCREKGVKLIRGVYIPTAKNKPCAGLCASLGFESAGERGEAALWEYMIPENYENKNRYIEVVHEQS